MGVENSNKPANLTPRAFFVLALCWVLGLATWSPGKPQDTFQEKVLPVFEQNCLICHGGTQRSGLDLRTRESILRGGDRGPAVVPGDADGSLLYRLVSHADEPNMPMGGAKLPDADLATIVAWIRGLGLPPGQPAVPSPVSTRERTFWSFQKPIRPLLPEVRNRDWVRNEIDRFVLRGLEQKGLSPSPPADPLVLLRRAFIDLIGLPPSPTEIDAFLRDGSGRAYENAVERLLDSPRYGERWGRHWLDLARYADSGGFEFDYDRPDAWRYRDYVIRSFNEDKPYDRFILEQLAGDELDPGKPEALIATGFLRNGPTVDNASTEQTRMDELDDMVSTTGSVFLGLTVGCARCHDHKYDPISQRDYYRMQAIFFPSQKTDRLLVTADEETAFKTKNKEIDARIKPLRDRIEVIERPHRERLLDEKAEFFTRVAAQAGALEGKGQEEYKRGLLERFSKDVKLQPEEIEASLSSGELRARKEIQDQIDAFHKTRPKPLPRAMGVTDKGPEPGKCFLLIRGDFRRKGEEVEPGFPAVLAGEGTLPPTPPGAASSQRRRRLAEWIAGPENPLTARVAVNRIWQYHFGRGIVKTPSDFGVFGDRPSHPELLDWLAVEFVARGWSFKSMHRLVMTSTTYRQSSRFDANAGGTDPENRLLWRMNPRRLESETIRDAILAVSGRLNLEPGGPGVYPRINPSVISTGSTNKWPVDVQEGLNEWRRSVYIFVKRSVIVPLMEVFDCPDTTVSSPVRVVSTTPTQALALLNNSFVLEQAGYFARRVLAGAGPDLRAQVEKSFRIALGRPPDGDELLWATEFLVKQRARYGKSTVKAASAPDLPAVTSAEGLAALRDFCHALFNLNEFIYAD